MRSTISWNLVRRSWITLGCIADQRASISLLVVYQRSTRIATERCSKRAIEEHSNKVDIHALLSQVTFRDDVSSVTGVSVDDSSPFSYTKDVEVSGHTV